MVQYTAEDCIEALQTAADELGKSPTVAEYKELDIKPSQGTIAKKFDGWSVAKQIAELDVDNRGGESYNKDDCINALQKAADELDRSPSIDEYRGLDISPSYLTIINEFGSWNGAKVAAGLDRRKSVQSYADDDIIKAIGDVGDGIDGYLTMVKYEIYKDEDDPSSSAAMQRFGSWSNALEESGENNRRDEYIKMLKHLDDKVDGELTIKQYRRLKKEDHPTFVTLRNNFGSWSEAKETAGISDGGNYTKEDCIEALRKAFTNVDLFLSVQDYRDMDMNPPSWFIIKEFGGWDEAKEVAGIDDSGWWS